MKFKLISHRGNLSGPEPDLENNPSRILQVISLGYDVEIDVWFVDNKFFLGHDKPQYVVDEKFLENKKIWCHAKNLEAFGKMIDNKKIHCFWHQDDDYALTTLGYIVTNIEVEKHSKKSIIVLQEKTHQPSFNQSEIAGICSDFIENYSHLTSVDGVNHAPLKADYIEIGTSCFNTLVQTFAADNSVSGISVDPVTPYLDILKNEVEMQCEDGNESKYFENSSVMPQREKERRFYYVDTVSLFKTIKHKEEKKLKNPRVGIAGTSSFNKSIVESELIKQYGEKSLTFIRSKKIKCITYEDLVKKFNVQSVGYLKIDIEGYDFKLVESIIQNDFVVPDVIQFETIFYNKSEIKQIKKRLSELNYFCLSDIGGNDLICCKRKEVYSSSFIEKQFKDPEQFLKKFSKVMRHKRLLKFTYDKKRDIAVTIKDKEKLDF